MPSERQNKVSRLLQKEMGDILQKDLKNFAPGHLITVTIVRITADLSLAKFYFSIYPSGDAQKILGALKDNDKKIRHILGNRIRHQLKSIPEIQFYIDDSLDYIEKIDNLLKK